LDEFSWRNRAAFALATCVWLLAWFAGWRVAGILVPGSFAYAIVGSVVGWGVGLGLATLILFLNERL